MKLIEITSQHRRDVTMTLECEKPGCGAQERGVPGYDDANYWDNVLPALKCKACGESTTSLGLVPAPIAPKYEPWRQV